MTGVNHVDEQVRKVNETDARHDNKAPLSNTFSIDNTFIYFTDILQLSFSEQVNELSPIERSHHLFTHAIRPPVEPPDAISDSLLFHA